VLVVDFMCPSDAPGVPVIGVPEDFKALVDKDVVHQEIGDPIRQDPQANGPTLPKIRIGGGHDKRHADHGVEYEESVIAFEPGIVVFPVVVPVETPQKPMHDILMGKPRHELHDAEGCYKNADPVQYLHNLNQI
jgi:hypothetical protein